MREYRNANLADHAGECNRLSKHLVQGYQKITCNTHLVDSVHGEAEAHGVSVRGALPGRLVELGKGEQNLTALPY